MSDIPRGRAIGCSSTEEGDHSTASTKLLRTVNTSNLKAMMKDGKVTQEWNYAICCRNKS